MLFIYRWRLHFVLTKQRSSYNSFLTNRVNIVFDRFRLNVIRQKNRFIQENIIEILFNTGLVATRTCSHLSNLYFYRETNYFPVFVSLANTPQSNRFDFTYPTPPTNYHVKINAIYLMCVIVVRKFGNFMKQFNNNCCTEKKKKRRKTYVVKL